VMLYYLSNLIFGTKPRYLDLYHLVLAFTGTRSRPGPFNCFSNFTKHSGAVLKQGPATSRISIQATQPLLYRVLGSAPCLSKSSIRLCRC